MAPLCLQELLPFGDQRLFQEPPLGPPPVLPPQPLASARTSERNGAFDPAGPAAVVCVPAERQPHGLPGGVREGLLHAVLLVPEDAQHLAVHPGERGGAVGAGAVPHPGLAGGVPVHLAGHRVHRQGRTWGVSALGSGEAPPPSALGRRGGRRCWNESSCWRRPAVLQVAALNLEMRTSPVPAKMSMSVPVTCLYHPRGARQHDLVFLSVKTCHVNTRPRHTLHSAAPRGEPLGLGCPSDPQSFRDGP